MKKLLARLIAALLILFACLIPVIVRYISVCGPDWITGHVAIELSRACVFLVSLVSGVALISASANMKDEPIKSETAVIAICTTICLAICGVMQWYKG